ncbi:MAG: hypothetical protein H7832_00550 [Magnetococcus sp. DMHC-6]
MSLTGLNNTNSLAAIAPDPLKQKIRTASAQTKQMFDTKANEGSQMASSKTKKMAEESYRLSLSSNAMEQGPIYAKPR